MDLPFRSEPPHCFNQNRVFLKAHEKFVDTELRRLCDNKAIKKVQTQPKNVLALKVIPKKNGKLRLVVDCRPVNDHMIVPKFSQEGIVAVSELIEDKDILMTVDVKDGFHHVPLSAESQSYIGMYWKGHIMSGVCFVLELQWRHIFSIKQSGWWFNI